MGTWKQKRSRKALTIDDAMLRMTDTIKKLEEIIMTSEDDNKVINASNALSGVVSRLSKLYETHNLEKRLEKLEQRMEQNSKLRKVQ